MSSSNSTVNAVEASSMRHSHFLLDVKKVGNFLTTIQQMVKLNFKHSWNPESSSNSILLEPF